MCNFINVFTSFLDLLSCPCAMMNQNFVRYVELSTSMLLDKRSAHVICIQLNARHLTLGMRTTRALAPRIYIKLKRTLEKEG